jgi:hypothetical protein
VFHTLRGDSSYLCSRDERRQPGLLSRSLFQGLNRARIMQLDDVSKSADDNLLTSHFETNFFSTVRMTSALIDHLDGLECIVCAWLRADGISVTFLHARPCSSL